MTFIKLKICLHTLAANSCINWELVCIYSLTAGVTLKLWMKFFFKHFFMEIFFKATEEMASQCHISLFQCHDSAVFIYAWYQSKQNRSSTLIESYFPKKFPQKLEEENSHSWSSSYRNSYSNIPFISEIQGPHKVTSIQLLNAYEVSWFFL